MASSTTSAKSPYSASQTCIARCTTRWTLNYSSSSTSVLLSPSSFASRALLSRLVRNEYPHSVPIASSICAFDSALGSSERDTAFYSTHDTNSSSSAATASCLRI
ncbi:hypothetical protein IG631_23795 [Alternaria alternata]|nr:hypothetical protein IG631_23795 [Alternaria alternata]